MPHAMFPVEVLTPEGEVFNGEVEMVSTRTSSVRSPFSPDMRRSWRRSSRPSCGSM